MLMKGEHCSMKNKKDKDSVLKIVSSVFTEEWLRMMEINPKFFLHDAESALRRRRFEVGGSVDLSDIPCFGHGAPGF